MHRESGGSILPLSEAQTTSHGITLQRTFHTLLAVEPYKDQAYYVGFRVGDQEIALDPNGHKAGVTSYYHVDDIKQSLQSLVNTIHRKETKSCQQTPSGFTACFVRRLKESIGRS